MADLYTSYETSVALRDAGAPQGDYTAAELYYCGVCGRAYLASPSNYWRRAGCTEAWCGCGVHRTHARAFRTDEIVEALTGRIDMLTPFKSGRWACRIKPASVPPGQVWVDDYFGDSMVEALAAAWRAVLKAERAKC